jgi:hypothetical protein
MPTIGHWQIEDTATGACLPRARPHAASSGTPGAEAASLAAALSGRGAAACPAPESAAVKVVATGGFNTPAGNLPVKVDVPATGNAQQTKGGLQLPVPH